MKKRTVILGIETSCDDTSAAVCEDDKILANIVAGQQIHAEFGGVVPELASRAHQQKILYVVEEALRQANVGKNDLTAIACTTGPGLMGSLMVGLSFAKGMALALDCPLIGVNHMQAHVLAHFAAGSPNPGFPFLCLTVSGGHTQLIRVQDHLHMELLGETRDDAAGEAFDKIAKVLGLPYPGGPQVDKLAWSGNPDAFRFPHPVVPELDFSFSGLKTSVLYFIQNQEAKTPGFVAANLNDLCASIQKTIVDILVRKTIDAAKLLNINTIALSGGVSANSGLRQRFASVCAENGMRLHVAPPELCTDNAGMIALSGYFRYLNGMTSGQELAPEARFSGL